MLNFLSGFSGFILKTLFRPFMSAWFGLNQDSETNWDSQSRAHAGFGTASTAGTGSILPEYVLKRLLKPPDFFGDPGPFAVAGEINEHTGETVRFVRYRPLAVPRSQASASQVATPIDLTADSTEATIQIWEAFTRFTSRANFYLGHSVFENALNRHAELFHRTGRSKIFEVLVEGTNTFFGGGQTSIPNLTATDNDIGDRASLAVTAIREGGAGPCDGRYYAGFCHPRIIEILNQDSTYVDAESFQGRGLYNLEVPAWKGVTWYPTNLLPIRTRDASVITEATATSGGTLDDSTEHFYKIVGINPLTGMIQSVTPEGSHTTGAAAAADDNTISLTMPAAVATAQDANINLVYDVYFGVLTGDANLFLQTSQLSNAAAAVVVIGTTAITAAGTTAPAAPAANVSTSPIILLGEEAYGNVYSKLYPYGNFKAAVVGGTPTVGNEVGKIRSVGWSLDMRPLILNQLRMGVIWPGFS